jgi:hypothetical protein
MPPCPPSLLLRRLLFVPSRHADHLSENLNGDLSNAMNEI